MDMKLSHLMRPCFQSTERVSRKIEGFQCR